MKRSYLLRFRQDVAGNKPFMPAQDSELSNKFGHYIGENFTVNFSLRILIVNFNSDFLCYLRSLYIRKARWPTYTNKGQTFRVFGLRPPAKGVTRNYFSCCSGHYSWFLLHKLSQPLSVCLSLFMQLSKLLFLANLFCKSFIIFSSLPKYWTIKFCLLKYLSRDLIMGSIFYNKYTDSIR